MELPQSREQAATLSVLATIGSTNDELVRRAGAGELPEFSVLLTTDQTAGRGRLGRVWEAPAGKTIAVSVLLRPRLALLAGTGKPGPEGAGDAVALGLEHFGWLPLLAGIAMTRSVAERVPEHRVTLKWPNDVLIDGAKVAGILAELLPGGAAVVIGVGVNLTIERAELPTATSTSLLLNGADLVGDDLTIDTLADAVLSAFLRELKSLYRDFLDHGADPEASGVRAALLEQCGTIGQRVKVQLPGDHTIFGTAIDVDRAGRLMVRDATNDLVQAVAAGDVTHLRYE
ncbi:MAG: BirA family transcriptional regulator [Microbacteriaceae bacterium]|jgi:BirA family biotin operon repressor/biotin-[acetyl-CoA-carboxylase] ligase|nr:BirA family transcriptional regulator [Microbacteriaceae bacterium]